MSFCFQIFGSRGRAYARTRTHIYTYKHTKTQTHAHTGTTRYTEATDFGLESVETGIVYTKYPVYANNICQGAKIPICMLSNLRNATVCVKEFTRLNWI